MSNRAANPYSNEKQHNEIISPRKGDLSRVAKRSTSQVNFQACIPCKHPSQCTKTTPTYIVTNLPLHFQSAKFAWLSDVSTSFEETNEKKNSEIEAKNEVRKLTLDPVNVFK